MRQANNKTAHDPILCMYKHAAAAPSCGAQAAPCSDGSAADTRGGCAMLVLAHVRPAGGHCPLGTSLHDLHGH
jgi:hypothetical protein